MSEILTAIMHERQNVDDQGTVDERLAELLSDMGRRLGWSEQTVAYQFRKLCERGA